jgi:alpha-beta hydrolase superfamily lysophospholipase
MVQPIYFGEADRQLFGVYHPPRARRATDAGVLLCYPLMQEYMRTHWAFRRLADLLSGSGFHVLRFDYYGTGDSAGDPHQAGVKQWCADIRSAAAELQDLGAARRLSVVGLRLGASLAVLAASQGLEVQDLALWEPAIDGSSHVRDLRGIEKTKHANLAYPPGTGPGELLDYPFPEEFRAGLERIDLRTAPRCNSDRILLFASRPMPDQGELQACLRDRAGRAPECRIVPDVADGRREGVLLSARVPQAIATALSGASA